MKLDSFPKPLLALLMILTLPIPESLSQITTPGPCPAGSPSQLPNRSGVCELPQTVELHSHDTFDCHGHILSPPLLQRAGSRRPQVAIFVNDGSSDFRDVTIRNCRIVGFEFGVFAVKSKPTSTAHGGGQVGPGRSGGLSLIMHDNTISASFAGVSLMSVDNSEIYNNLFEIKSGYGRALYVGRNSDGNYIHSNTITKTGSLPEYPVYRAPGPNGDENPPVNQIANPIAVVITQTENHEPDHLKAEINGRSFYIPVYSEPPPLLENDFQFSDDNEFSGNLITLSGERPTDAVVVSTASNTKVLCNTVTGARFAIRVGVKPDQPAPKDRPATYSYVGSGNLIGANHIQVPQADPGSPRGAIAVGAQQTRIEFNTIQPKGTGAGGIFLFGQYGLGWTVVKNNYVSVREPLEFRQCIRRPIAQLDELCAQSFNARVYLNNFTGYNPGPAVRTSNGYNLPSELSFMGQGNYWGSQQGLQPNAVEDLSGNTVSDITDSNPLTLAVPPQRGSIPAACCPR